MPSALRRSVLQGLIDGITVLGIHRERLSFLEARRFFNSPFMWAIIWSAVLKGPWNGPPSASSSWALMIPRGGRTKSPMKLTVTFYQDEDGAYIVECPAIPGCVSQGSSQAEAEANIEDAIRQSLAARAELGLPLTVHTKEIEVAV
jgi:predicted RNase H-like HicB family nuclease